MKSQFEQLNEIARLLRLLNKTLCCEGTPSTPGGGGGNGGTFNGEIISSCQKPVYTSWCESPQLFTQLQAIKEGIDDISVTAENIYLEADEINLNVDGVEALITNSNTLLGRIETEVKRGANCTTPQFVNVCNQISLSALENTLGNVLTQLTAINGDTDKLAALETELQALNGRLVTVNNTLASIKTDTASIVTNIATTNTQLATANTSLDNIELYTKVIYDITAEFQPLDCGNQPVGSPIDVIPVVVANNLNTHICNTAQLATEIGNAISFPTSNNYNTVTQNEYTTGTSTIAANTIHAISYVILSGTCVVNIGGNSSTYSAGESSEEEATTLINVAYSFTPGANSKVRVKTVRP